MRIAAFPIGELRANCYVVSGDDTHECIIIDPGQHAASEVNKLVDAEALRPAALLATHGHADHIWDAAILSTRYDVPLIVGEGDHFMVEDPSAGVGQGLAALFPQSSWQVPQSFSGFSHTSWEAAGVHIEIIDTPGHTPGGVTLVISDGRGAAVAFTGDTLFKGAVGRTDLVGGDQGVLMESFERLLTCLPDSTVIAPGHGEASTLGEERSHNIYLSRFR